MHADEFELALAKLDQAESCVFRLVEAEPDLIRQPEILDILMHLKNAISSLQTLGQRSRIRTGIQHVRDDSHKA